jgi:Flp pilus assembly protein TadB
MPLWLDLLRTPMAAPETDDLRIMRRTFQVLCVLSGIGVIAISPLVALFGRPASLIVAAILAMTALHTPHSRRKGTREAPALPDAVAECVRAFDDT